MAQGFYGAMGVWMLEGGRGWGGGGDGGFPPHLAGTERVVGWLPPDVWRLRRPNFDLWKGYMCTIRTTHSLI